MFQQQKGNQPTKYRPCAFSFLFRAVNSVAFEETSKNLRKTNVIGSLLRRIPSNDFFSPFVSGYLNVLEIKREQLTKFNEFLFAC